MRRIVLLLLLAGCTERGVRDQLTIEVGRDDLVTVTAVTQPASDAAREAILAGRDDWSMRFARVAAESERTVIDRKRGVLQRMERSAVMSVDDLQRFFGDTSVTVRLLRGDGWSELALFPGASTRATRQQREHFDKALARWSERAVAYFDRMRVLYAYLEEKPYRAQPVFDQLLVTRSEAVVDETERSLIDGVFASLEALSETPDEEALTLDEEADLVVNPLPADVTIIVPGEIVEPSESADRRVTIVRKRLLDAVASLEGRWLSPEPLTVLLREGDEPPNVRELAARRRNVAPVVTASEIEKAVRDALKPAEMYRVRWED